MSIRKSARHIARELCVQGLYSWLISKQEAEIGVIEANLREQENYAKADTALLNTLFAGAIAHAGELREQIAPYLDRRIDELSPIEHAVLLLGSYELVYVLENPYRVIINESIELTKDFGGTDGFKFVNGVLDKLALQVRSLEVKGGK